MIGQIKYARSGPRREVKTPLVRLLRLMLLFGVWIVVGLAGLAAYARLVT